MNDLRGKILADKYRIESLIGSGGMADVYKAVQLSTQRPVAVKVLKEEFRNNAEFVRRFQREAQAVLTLSHENIVRSFDVGEDQNCYYIVLEYVQGQTLKEMIQKDGPMDARTAIHLGAQVLDALAHAHARGIIHRDVKPQNVIVTRKNRAKLADFGIARDVGASTMTFAGSTVLGSVHYLSPEQASGEPVTEASDVYSMGIVLYEMVTGEVPFKGENSVSVALKHLQEDVKPPSLLVPNLPRALNDVIVKATRRDPQDRYESAKQMRHDLLRVLKEPQGTFVQLTRKKPARKNKDNGRTRNRRVIARIAIAVAAIVAFIVAIFLVSRSAIDTMHASSNTEYVPKLTEKTLEEAQETARLRGYTIDVTSWEADPEVAAGVVLYQDPAPGSLAASGSAIRLTVSSGMEAPTVPNLYGMTLAGAMERLHELGLSVGAVEYQISSEPVGTVIKQDPVEGTEVVLGDEVRIFLSGEPDEGVEMPEITQKSLVDVLAILSERGFDNIRVRLDQEERKDGTEQNTVLTQLPATGERVRSDTVVELTVYNTASRPYMADVAFNVDIAHADTPVMVTLVREINGVQYEIVLYETMLAAGQQRPVSFTAQSSMPGQEELVLYVDGERVNSTTMNFVFRG